MCGRYTLKTLPEVLQEQFQLAEAPAMKPRFNIAPSQLVACVRMKPETRRREGVLLRWGLVPSWARDPAMGMKLINARAETVAEKPAFRKPFRHQRCLVLADGFYEWQRLGRIKQPYYIRMADERPFAFAGLWDHWAGKDGAAIESCALLTTDANEVMAPIHDRMPVILRRSDYEQWLDPEIQNADVLKPLLRSYPPEEMIAIPISTKVNNPRNDDASCIAAAEIPRIG